MIQEKNKVSVKMNKGKHGRLAMERAHARGQALPVAITLGQEPAVMLSSQMPLPPSVNEYEFAGWMQGSPIPVVRGAVTGLPIPANGEVVLEGEIPPLPPEQLPKEGPFGEWPGYYTEATEGRRPAHDRQAGLLPRRPHHPRRSAGAAAQQLPAHSPGRHHALGTVGEGRIPDVKGVWGFVYGGQPGPFTVISIKQRYTGHAKQALLVAAGARAGAYGGKMVVVVDDDVDITNPGEVIWAMSTRCDPREGIDIVKNVWASVCEPVISPMDRDTKGYVTDRVLIDACRPYQWIDPLPAGERVRAGVQGQGRQEMGRMKGSSG